MNATPQEIPEVSKEVEKFLRNIPGLGKKKKERKLIRSNIIEVLLSKYLKFSGWKLQLTAASAYIMLFLPLVGAIAKFALYF